jgi:hypothetical protein
MAAEASCAFGQGTPESLSVDGPNNKPDIIPYVQHNVYNRKKIYKKKIGRPAPIPVCSPEIFR